MKKTFLSMLLAASCFGVANAQLMVDQNGKVGGGIETEDALYSQFAMNGRGEIDVAVHVNTQDCTGLKINLTYNIARLTQIYRCHKEWITA